MHSIVLSKIRYSDYDLIIKTYTKENGIVSFIIKGAMGLRNKKIQASSFQLLSQLFVVMDFKQERQLQRIKEASTSYFYKSIYTDIYKSAIVMFLSEVLASVIKEEESNEELFEFLITAFQWLDVEENYANFHLIFLLRLTKYLGFYPEAPINEVYYFNLSSGTFSKKEVDVYSVSGHNLTVLKQLLGTNFDKLNTIQLNAKRRQSFLNMLLLYFELHLGDFKKPKSLEVFKEVFS